MKNYKLNLNIFNLLFLIILNLNYVLSQEIDTVYYTPNWERTVKSKANYYRVVQKSDSNYFVTDYFLNGTIQMTGYFLDKEMEVREGQFHYFTKESKLIKIIQFKNNKWDGECTWFYENGVASSIEIYNQDSLISFTFYKEDKTIDVKPKTLNSFEHADPPGGQDVMNEWLMKNLKYPAKAIKRKQNCIVDVKFWVEKDGEITNVKAQNWEYPLLSAEAERVIKLMPKWKNAKYHNLPSRQTWTIPINFTLED